MKTPWTISMWLWLPPPRHLSIVSRRAIVLGISCFSFADGLRFWHQRCFDLCTWLWWGQSWSTASRCRHRTFSATSVWMSAYSARWLVWSVAWGGYHMKNDFVDSIFFFLWRRHLRRYLILSYNIFHSRVDFPQAEAFENPTEMNQRGHEFKKRRRRLRLLQRKEA